MNRGRGFFGDVIFRRKNKDEDELIKQDKSNELNRQDIKSDTINGINEDMSANQELLNEDISDEDVQEEDMSNRDLPGKKKKKPAVQRRARSKKKKTIALAVVGNAKARIFVGQGMKAIRDELKQSNPKTLKEASTIALRVARREFKKKDAKHVGSRILPIPRVGGILNKIIPSIASLSAVGHIPGGAERVAEAVKDLVNLRASNLSKNVKGNIVKGLKLKPHRNGYGLFLD